MTISATTTSFNRAKGCLREAAGTLRHDKLTIDDRVTGFLRDGWTGVAAASFVAAWQEWKQAAEDVEQGLAAMAVLVEAAQRDVTTQDAASQAALDRISALIIDRLG